MAAKITTLMYITNEQGERIKLMKVEETVTMVDDKSEHALDIDLLEMNNVKQILTSSLALIQDAIASSEPKSQAAPKTH